MKILSKATFMAAAAISIFCAAPSFATDYATPIAAVVNQSLHAGDSFVSQDGRFKLTFQYDGNLVLYQGTTVLWDTNTAIGVPTNGWSPDRTTFQGDGNFVQYEFHAGTETKVFDTNTQGHSSATFVVQNDGNVVIYNGSSVLWATHTCCH